MHFSFSMSKLIGHNEKKYLLHKNEAFYLGFLIHVSSQHFKEPMCQKLYNRIKDLKYFEDITIYESLQGLNWKQKKKKKEKISNKQEFFSYKREYFSSKRELFSNKREFVSNKREYFSY